MTVKHQRRLKGLQEKLDVVFCRTINQIVDFFSLFFSFLYFFKIFFLMLEYTQRHPFEVNNNRNLPVSLRVCAWVCVYMWIKCGHVPGESPPHSWSHSAGWPEGEKTGKKETMSVYFSCDFVHWNATLSHSSMVAKRRSNELSWNSDGLGSEETRNIFYFFLLTERQSYICNITLFRC